MDQLRSDAPQSEARYWLTFAAITLTLILVAAIRWSLAHPLGIHWDEAGYLNDALIDAQRLRHGMLLKFGGRILLRSWGRPPAYRLLGDPILALFGANTTVARLVSLSCFCLTSWYVYLTASRISSRIAGAFAFLIFCLSPEVIAASTFFGTDAPLYLATSAMLFFLCRSLDPLSEHSNDWLGLGLAVGLGFLSKTSFFLIGPPALVCWFLASRRVKRGKPVLALPFKASIVALLLAGPWWLLNAKGAFAYGEYARKFVRNSMGPPSVATWLRWLNSVIQCLLGVGLSIVIALVVMAFFVCIIAKKKASLTSFQRAAVWVSVCAGAPIILAQLSGTNYLLRHISPSVIPLAIVVGVLADQSRWARIWPSIAVYSALFCAQLCMLVYPVVLPNTGPVGIGFVNGALPWRAMARFDQWNWKPVWEISQACHIDSPKISYLGDDREFDPPAIAYPWVIAGFPTRLSALPFPDVIRLWRYEDGKLDWQKVMNEAEDSDFVITAPDFAGEDKSNDDKDNQYNAEFADRLAKDPEFKTPILFHVGRFEPIEIAVFPKRNLGCPSLQIPFEKSGK